MADERTPRTDPIDLSESVAGEEDPGASIDLAMRSPAATGAADPDSGVPRRRTRSTDGAG